MNAWTLQLHWWQENNIIDCFQILVQTLFIEGMVVYKYARLSKLVLIFVAQPLVPRQFKKKSLDVDH